MKVGKLLTCFLFLNISVASGVGREFYVATDGDDGSLGTKGSPFATVHRARDAIRAIKLGRDGLPPGGVTVWIRGGFYFLEETFLLTPQDSGTVDAPVVYAAYPGENPILCGGRRITGWKQESKQRWSTEILDVKKGAWWFRQLFCSNKRLARARHPNSDDWAACKEKFTITKISEDLKTLEFKEDLPQGNFFDQNTELVVIQNWSITRSLVASVNNKTVKTVTPVGVFGLRGCTARPGKKAFWEHALDFADQPGEWYLDRRSGILTYQAREGEKPNEQDFYAPRLGQLVRLDGRPEEPVRNVHFRGLRFEYAGWTLPAIGYRSVQAGHYGTRKAKPNEPAELGYSSPVAVELYHAIGCLFELCRISHVGASGLGLGAGCRLNKIIGCEFYDIGGNGVMVGYRQDPEQGPYALDKDWDDFTEVPVGNEVSNNYLHRCGTVLFGAVGIFEAFSQETRIAHNELTDLPYSGISAGFRWGYEPTSQKGTIIEYNHIHNVCRQLGDAAGIYTLGFQNGGIIRGNLIHDMESRGGHGVVSGYGPDAGSSGILLERNIFYQCDWPSKGHTWGKYRMGDPWKADWQNQKKEYWEKAKMTWKDNVFTLLPEDEKFPHKWADYAGLQPKYRKVLPFR